MSDYSTLTCDANTGASDASPTWTGITLGGTSGAHEIRWCASGAGGASTGSASWPYYTRPASTGVVPEAWEFSADTTGSKITTYDGTSAHYMQLRWNWDNTGTMVGAPSFSAYGDNTHAAASPGTQPGGQSGSPIINGSTDTSNTSYLKANAYGYGLDAAGAQQTPAANAGGTLAVTTGTAGSVSPGTGAWLATWQSLQAATQYILDAVTPKATTAGFWYFLLALFTGPTMSTGSLQPVITLSYLYA